MKLNSGYILLFEAFVRNININNVYLIVFANIEAARIIRNDYSYFFLSFLLYFFLPLFFSPRVTSVIKSNFSLWIIMVNVSFFAFVSFQAYQLSISSLLYRLYCHGKMNIAFCHGVI